MLHRYGVFMRCVLSCVAALGCAAPAALQAQDLRDGDAAPRATVDRVAQAFVAACVLTEGELTPAIDWAVNAGYLPVDTLVVDVRPLLGGQAGTVLSMPDVTAPVLLAVTADRGCTVWAERLSGPALRGAFQQAVDQLVRRGARVQPMLDRTVERAGAWRQHLQLRYRRAGGSHDHAIGAVTTLTPAPAQQALHLSPVRLEPDPNGPAVSR
jgi:hypothetical protein